MKRLIRNAVCAVILVSGSCVTAMAGSLDDAFAAILGLPGFTADKGDASMFNFPQEVGEGRLAVAPNADNRDLFVGVLDSLPADMLEGQLVDDDSDVRLYMQPSADGASVTVLYTIVGTGGADTVALIFSTTASLADNISEMWAEEMARIDNGGDVDEELEQDFGDE